MDKNKRTRILAAMALTLLVALACSLPSAAPGTQPTDPEAQFTVIAATAFAQLAQTLTQAAVSGSGTPPLPGVTSTPSLPPPPNETPTPSAPLISVSVDTNCRVGPGKLYDYLGALLVGETAEVLARSSAGDYWYIPNPDRPGDFCWVWGQYATVVGNTSNLPVYTPPPTPTPPLAFTFSYVNMGVGPGYQCLQFKVHNSGALNWDSYTLSIFDTTQGKTFVTAGNDFTNYDQWCSSTGGPLTISPGGSGTASVTTTFTSNPVGDHIAATLTLCTENGQSGQCLTQTINFDL